MTASQDGMHYTKGGQHLYKEVFGWFPDESAAVLDRLIAEHHISQVIEIGAFLGRSTIFFLSRVLETLVVDTFTMWPEGRQNGDAMREGGEDFYDKFAANIEAARSKGRNLAALRVLRTTSELAWENNPDLKADLVYIDGSHDYDSVQSDLRTWGGRARKIICGDDYDDNWPGVKRAVDEIFPDRIIEGRFWYKLI